MMEAGMLPPTAPPARQDMAARLRRSLHAEGLNLDKILRRSLEFLAQETALERASIFLFEGNGESCREHIRLESDGSLIEGYRQEPVREGNAFHALLTGPRNVLVTSFDDGEPMRHVFIRLDLPSESGNKPAPGSPKGIAEFVIAGPADLETIRAWCQEMEQWLALGLMERKLEKHSQQVKAFGDLSWLFVTSLRLEDRLRLIIEGIQKLFGFDRIRLYLLNPEGTALTGELETNIRRQMMRIQHERYPLPPEPKGLVELLWTNLRLNSWSRILEYSLANHDKMLYLPLKVHSKEIGVLVVDNLISQEPISEEVRNLLQSFTGQLSLAVDNSRLFSEVERLSLYDTLSHLPNRRYFDQRLQEEIYRSSRAGLSFAVCLVDLDFFKEINDAYGHQMGDQAISKIGLAIKSILRQSDFAARWGGDELAILLGNTNDSEALVVVARVMNAIREVTMIHPSDPPKEVRLTASIGIGVYPRDGADIPSLIASADRALYEVKFRGRDGFLFASQLTLPSA